MDSRAWCLLADKTFSMLAADHDGIFRDLRPEMEKRLFDADPDKDLRYKLQKGDGTHNVTAHSRTTLSEAEKGEIREIMKMPTKDEILGRLAELKSISPDNAAEAFLPLEEAVEAYFDPTEELEYCVADAVYQVALNYEYRNSVYKSQSVMPTFRTDNLPPGYEDVRELFGADGAWNEISETPEDDFVAAFQMDEGGDGTVNTFLSDWTSRVEAAKGNLIQGLKDISQYCEKDATNNGLAVHFEDFEELVSVPDKREVAERVFVSGGYIEVIHGFNLDIHIPTYLRE